MPGAGAPDRGSGPFLAAYLIRGMRRTSLRGIMLTVEVDGLVCGSGSGRSRSMSEENKSLARRSWEIVNQHDPDLIDEMYAADFVWHEPDQDIRGSEEARQFVTMF